MIKFFLWLLVCVFSTLGVVYFYYKITDSQLKLNIKTFFVYVVGTVFMAIIKFYNLNLLSALFYFLFYPIMFYIINPLPFRKLIFYVIIVWFFGIILDLLSMVFVSCFYAIFNIHVNLNLLSLLLTLFVFVFMIFLARRKFVIKLCDRLYSLTLKIKYYDVLLISLILFIFVMGFLMLFNLDMFNITFLISVIIIETFLLFVLSIKAKLNMTESLIFLKTLKENNDFYIMVEEENSILKHNLIAKLLSIKSVSNRKTKLLVDDLIENYSVGLKYKENIKSIPYGLNGIIYQKIYPYLNELDIKLINTIHYDIFDVLSPRRYNVLVEKVVLALDNAIEASLVSDEKIVYICIYDNDKEIFVEIRNSFGNDLNVDDIGMKKYSTKGNKRGIGLFSILRNNEATFKIKIINNMFITVISARKTVD